MIFQAYSLDMKQWLVYNTILKYVFIEIYVAIDYTRLILNIELDILINLTYVYIMNISIKS